MWDFMARYAEGFWHYTEQIAQNTWEVFTTLIAWTITLGILGFIYCVLTGIGWLIKEEIKDRRTIRMIQQEDQDEM